MATNNNPQAEGVFPWDDALARYTAAKSAEDAYEADFYMPAYQRWAAAVELHGRGRVSAADLIPEDIEREIERLQNLRHDAEDEIMSVPAPDAIAFARKFLVAHGEGRNGNGWDEMLEAEAKRFAEKPADRISDDPALAIWTEYREAYLGHLASIRNDEPYQLQHPWGVRCDEADDAQTLTHATTPAGVAGKLRRLFMQLNRAEWAERLALGIEHPGDRHSLELSDIYTRMMWGAIQDLEQRSLRQFVAGQDDWERALTAYSAIHAAASRRGLSEEEVDILSSDDNVAFRAMVSTPVPDLAALKTKMEIGLADVWGQCHAEPEEVAALLADVSRLGGE